MAKYSFNLKNGKKLTLEGDTQPSDEEVESIAKQQGVELELATPEAPAPVADIPDSKAPPVKEPNSKSSLARAWDYINEPLTNIPSQTASKVSEWINPDRETTGLRGIGSAFVESLGNVADSLTSPLDLGLGALSGGAALLRRPGIKTIANAAEAAASGAFVGEGAYDLSQGDLGGALEVGLGAAGLKHSMPTKAKTAKLIPEQKQPITQPNVSANTSSIPPSQKPRMRLDIESGSLIPIDDAGKQTGMAQIPGKEYVGPPSSKYSQQPSGKQPSLDETNQLGRLVPEKDKKTAFQQVRDANRALLTAYDFSAPGRQGKALMGSKAYWTSFDDMFKAWGSDNAYKSVMESIDSSPNFSQKIYKNAKGEPVSLAERAGLRLKQNDIVNASWADKLPGVTRSQRAYEAFLAKLRADHFNNLVKDYADSGIDIAKDDVKLKALGSFINDATGSGSFQNFIPGKSDKVARINTSLEKSGDALSELFFAPRLMASRVNMYKRWLNPMTYANNDPVMRKQVLKSLLSTVGFGVSLGELARLAGAEVSNDPTSSDFRKIKIGNTRVDPFSGFQQYASGAAKLISGESTSSVSGKVTDLTAGKYGQQTRGDVVANFFKNKLAPVPSLVWSWLDGKEFDGQKFEWKKALMDRTVPIVLQDLNELAQEDPRLLMLAPLPVIGEGIQTYGR